MVWQNCVVDKTCISHLNRIYIHYPILLYIVSSKMWIFFQFMFMKQAISFEKDCQFNDMTRSVCWQDNLISAEKWRLNAKSTITLQTVHVLATCHFIRDHLSAQTVTNISWAEKLYWSQILLWKYLYRYQWLYAWHTEKWINADRLLLFS